nr:acrosin-like [Drosophila kikkawai]
MSKFMVILIFNDINSHLNPYKSPCVAIALLSQAFNMKIIGVLSILLSCAILGYGTNSVSLLEPNCGISISSSRNGTLRIIGGKIADMYGNPWMAYISSSLGACGGSLITNRKSALCSVLLIASVNLQLQPIPNKLTPFFIDFIRPICLPTNFSPLDQTTHLTTTGWGKTEYGVPSSVLKTTTLTQYDRWACSSRYHSNVDTSQICAGSPSSSSCNGDSGGPITTVYPINGRNRVIQLGTVSYGDIYCQSLGVYTNVIHYMAWIGTTIQQGGDQHTPAPTQSPSHSNNNNPNYPLPSPPSFPLPPPPSYPIPYPPNYRPPSYGIPYPPNYNIPNGNYPNYNYPNGIYG